MTDFKAIVQDVLDGKITDWKDEDIYMPVQTLRNKLLEIEGIAIDEDNFETNGWQWDWWQLFTYKGKSYTIAGSGFYAGLHLFETEE